MERSAKRPQTSKSQLSADPSIDGTASISGSSSSDHAAEKARTLVSISKSLKSITENMKSISANENIILKANRRIVFYLKTLESKEEEAT